MSLYLSSGRVEEKRSKARLLCVVPVITVVIVIHAHVNFNRGWLDRVFLNCGWLDRGELGSLALLTLMVHALPLTPLKTHRTSHVFFIFNISGQK